MAYSIAFRQSASKAFQELDKPVRERIGKVITRLSANPRPSQATQLVGDRRTWRIRAGDWRILYEIHDDDLMVLVIDVGHRSRPTADTEVPPRPAPA